jgi:transcriptional regulator with XRE-family HTH domain
MPDLMTDRRLGRLVVEPWKELDCPACGRSGDSLGARVLALRNARDLTRKAVRERGGPSTDHQSQIETAGKGVGRLALDQFAQVYGVPADLIRVYFEGRISLDELNSVSDDSS